MSFRAKGQKDRKEPPRISDAEWTVMKAIWPLKTARAREVVEALAGELVAAIRVVHAGGRHAPPELASAFLERDREPHAAAVAREGPQALTDREREILQLLARGRQNKEIVTALGISPSTVATHIRRIYEKL